MSPTLLAALSIAGAMLLTIGGIALAKSLTDKHVTTNVTVVRVNGQKVTQDVGTVLSWSVTNGQMRLEYEPDSIYSDGFEREAR